MKIYSYNIFYWLLFVCVGGCYIQDQSDILKPDSLIKMNNYTVRTPLSENWQSSSNDNIDALILSNVVDYGGIVIMPETFIKISVFRVTIPYGEYGIFRKDTIFNRYYGQIEETNNKNYATSGYCKVGVLKKDTINLKNKKLYLVDYSLSKCKTPDESDLRDGKGKIYFYFPQNYIRQKVFYLFQIEEFFRNTNNAEVKFKSNDIENFINSFSCKEDL